MWLWSLLYHSSTYFLSLNSPNIVLYSILNDLCDLTILKFVLLLCSDVSNEESIIVSEPLQQPTIKSHAQKTFTKSVEPESALNDPLPDINMPPFIKPQSTALDISTNGADKRSVDL